jgi:hypothetical protein
MPYEGMDDCQFTESNGWIEKQTKKLASGKRGCYYFFRFRCYRSDGSLHFPALKVAPNKLLFLRSLIQSGKSANEILQRKDEWQCE